MYKDLLMDLKLFFCESLLAGNIQQANVSNVLL